MLPGATGDCGDEAGLGIGAEENGSSGGTLKAEVICVHNELMLSPSPSTSGTEGESTVFHITQESSARMMKGQTSPAGPPPSRRRLRSSSKL